MNYSLIRDVFRTNRDHVALVEALRLPAYGKRKPYYVSGLTEGAEYIFHYALASDLADMEYPIVIIFSDEKKASSYSKFLQAEGLSAAFFPSREYCFFNITSSHDYEGERLKVLTSLSGVSGSDMPKIICTTPEAVLQVTMSRERLRELSITVSYDTPVSTADLASRLVCAGYKRVDLVEGVGQFALRGGIVDIFAPGKNPIRIELFGDEIDRMGYFSAETQRFLEFAPDSVVIPPVRELIITDEVRDKLTALIRGHMKKLGKTGESADVSDATARALSVLEAELSSLEHDFEINFADKYLPVIYPDSACMLDYVTGVVVISDYSGAEDRYAAQTALVEQSVTGMIEALEMPQIKNGIYMRDFEEIGGRQNGPTVFIDALSKTHSGFTPAGLFAFNTRHVPAYAGNSVLFRDDVARFSKEGYLCAVVCGSESECSSIRDSLSSDGYSVVSADRLDESERKKILLSPTKITRKPVLVMNGEYAGGFELAFPKFILMDFTSASSRSSRSRTMRSVKKKKTATEAIMSYADLEVGDIVVHEAYGIGQYMGIQNLTIDGSSRDYVHIKYSGTDKLFLPVDQLDHVSKYIGAGSDTGAVKLSKMGGSDWTRAKTKAKNSTREMARELIELYARRKRTKGFAFDADDDICREFAASFEYEETDGQLVAIEDIRRDMEAPYPMDRLLCGDVGYGKTEVALRAAFKAAMSGKQVAVLVPTTILAYQHYKTFLSRMRSFPVHVDMVSRFRSPSEQQAALRKVARGDTDIIIGTHRLISKDVSFHDLGLIIIDEEQRFGVAQKEKLKELSVGADILTLTATPIPRTLNMAMGGIVDMSILEEAPGLRSPVQTYVMEHDDALISEAIRRELRRGGQVFYLYNRVEGIYNVADKIKRSIPDARIAVAHGKMDRDDIEEVWDSLVRGDVDILVCTTIIETGIDVPNANTLIIENAENYGLSQLHQIRGRVGRSSTRAFAYLTYRRGKQLTEVAEKRLSAIREYAEFGAGFRIALRDLEIRGAGNLLGAEQHGHMEAVGYDLYMKLLEEAVVEEKGETKKKPLPECAVDIRCDAFLSTSYIPSAPQRMDMYKKIARVETEADYDDIIDELCDRFGEPNHQAVNLCRIARIRAMGRIAGFSKIEEAGGIIKLYVTAVNAAAIQSLASAYPELGVRMMFAQNPYITMKTRKNMRNTDFVLEVLEKYTKFIEESEKTQ